jgi:hypothetical protein
LFSNPAVIEGIQKFHEYDDSLTVPNSFDWSLFLSEVPEVRVQFEPHAYRAAAAERSKATKDPYGISKK